MKTSLIQAYAGGVVIYDGELLTMRIIQHLTRVPVEDWTFTWGRPGSIYLAAAILVKHTKKDAVALRYCLEFSREVLALMPKNEGFELPLDFVRVWLGRKMAREAGLGKMQFKEEN